MPKDYTAGLAEIGNELRGYCEQLARVPDERAHAMRRELERALRYAPEMPRDDTQPALREQADDDLRDDDDNDGA